MKSIIKKVYRRFLKKKHLEFKLFINTKLNIGNQKQCYVCKRTFHHFGKFRINSIAFNQFLDKLEIVGSDPNNFNCYFCGCHDRTRHLFMFFDKLNLWSKFTNAKVLHIAPELAFIKKIKTLNPSEYIIGDLNPYTEESIKIDVTNIQFEDSSIDIFLCNHVLEHVPDYKKALSEIFRVLKPNGIAILQTPYSLFLTNNFEEENANTNSLRLFFYAQEDHVRFFSQKQFFEDIEFAGFNLDIVKHNDLFSDVETNYYGVNKKEDLILVRKPK